MCGLLLAPLAILQLPLVSSIDTLSAAAGSLLHLAVFFVVGLNFRISFIGRWFRLVLKRASVFLWTGLWSKITEKKSGSAQIWLSYVHANSTITTITTTFSNLMCNSTKQYCYKSHIKTYSQNYLKVAHRLDNNSLWRSLNLKLVNNAISWDFSSLGPNSLQNILGVVYQDKICQVR